MKKINLLALTVLFTIFITSCTNDSLNPQANEVVLLKFENIIYEVESSKTTQEDSSQIEIEAIVVYENGEPKLISDELMELNAFIENSGEYIYGYILKETFVDNKQLNKKNVEKQPPKKTNGWGISSGYGFDGRCFVYGHFFHGDNGETLFVPCGPLNGCVGFPSYCPESIDSEFAFNPNVI